MTTSLEIKQLKKQVRAAAKRLGVTVDFETWNLDAPEGKRFAGTGTHGTVFEPWSVMRPDGVEVLGNDQIAIALKNALADLEDGLEDCPHDCECRDEV